jgi:hypothetical protein
MSLAAKQFGPLRRQLTAYEESWKQDHDEAMRCRDLEDVIAVGVSTFHLLRRIEQAWRDRVFRGTEAFAPEDDAGYREGYRLWLQTTESLLAQASSLAERFGTVSGAEELQECVRQARDLLAGWRPPALSAAVGLREMELDAAAADELRRLLDEANAPGAAPPRAVKRLPAGDASLLKKK